jgi:pilus assembly protein TadC
MKFKVYYHRIACKLIGFTKTDATLQKAIWYLCGVLVFETCYLISLSIAPYSNFKFLLFAVIGLVVGGKGKEKIESSRNRKRVLQLRIDFPYFVENLALCITAGLSPAMAINAILENDLQTLNKKHY